MAACVRLSASACNFHLAKNADPRPAICILSADKISDWGKASLTTAATADATASKTDADGTAREVVACPVEVVRLMLTVACPVDTAVDTASNDNAMEARDVHLAIFNVVFALAATDGNRQSRSTGAASNAAADIAAPKNTIDAERNAAANIPSRVSDSILNR